MPRLLVLALGALWLAEAAEAQEPRPSEPYVRPAGAPAPVPPEVSFEDLPAEELDIEGLWAWIARLEGEVPTREAQEVMRERAEEQYEELSVIDELAGVDVPQAFYDDPEGALAGDPLHLDLVDPSEFDIPIVINEHVIRWMRYFTGRGRVHYARWLGRSTRWRPLMYEELERRGLPRDLVYLSMIESGYSPHAYSHAHAAGLWQFIPSTARLYRMRVDWWVDERRDPLRSTEAGAEFLHDLKGMFNDWWLAWAAYNTGPGRVRRAMNRAESRDYWTLVEQNRLHPETANYVAKIIAAAIIGKHPERYGFTDITWLPPYEVEVARVDGSVDLEVLARCAGVSLDEFRALNPALRRWATPPEGADVRVPRGSRDRFVAALADVPAHQRVTVVQHRVGRGETLSTIASRYSISTQELARANRLADINRIYVGMDLVVPVPGDHGEQVAAAGTDRASDAPLVSRSVPRGDRPATHTVSAGENLSGIAARHGVTVADLRSWNNLRNDTIHPGQTLSLRGAGTASAAPVEYTVQRGDTLSGIASRYGVATADLQRWNNLRNASHIQAGQVLRVHLSDGGWKRYTVRPGDSLGAIARRHGCTVAELQAWNELSSTVIHPGQELRIRR